MNKQPKNKFLNKFTQTDPITPSAEAKRKDRERKRNEGYVLKQIWVKPDKWIELKKIINDFS